MELDDLISREALKKSLQARHDNGDDEFDKGYNIGIKSAIDLIDNAPTVERPQGEWARHDEWVGGEYVGGFYHIDCPCIDLESAFYSKWRTNFCPNCGASMKKGGAK
jgi:hypothetical protein